VETDVARVEEREEKGRDVKSRVRRHKRALTTSYFGEDRLRKGTLKNGHSLP